MPALPNATPVPPVAPRGPAGCERIALVLQGGGALGAYQAGVYQAMHEHGIEPGWLAGVSIGAVNAALIAGNPPERRVERLRAFWERISDSRVWPYGLNTDLARMGRNSLSAWLTMNLGQPGFFSPWLVNPWLSLPGMSDATSFYDSEPLRRTLTDLVDFRLINRPDAVRFTVAAVGVESGNVSVFHNNRGAPGGVEIGVDHVMASGALPPALPMVSIGEERFWDGGIVSNTPLQFLLEQEQQLNSLVFQVDLFGARGPVPKNMADVLSRQKDIAYSSRTRASTDAYKRKIRLQRELHAALAEVPEDQLTDQQRRRREELSHLPAITIIHLIYQRRPYEGEAKDYEFSAASMEDHWRSGHQDASRSLAQPGWLDLPPCPGDVETRDIHDLREDRG